MTTTAPPTERAPAPRRHRGRRPALVVAGAVAVAVVGTVYVAGWTPVMGVHTIRVEGPTTVPSEAVVAASGIAQGTPMMQVNLRAATARIADLPQVASVDVRRQWPRTIVVEVSERDAVAVRKAGDGWELLDSNGSAFAVAPGKPKDLPLLTMSPDPATNTAMFEALAGMSPEIRTRVAAVEAATPNAIRLTLRKGGAVVNWGSPADSAFKSQVLAVLLQSDAGWYDVTNPQTPTTADAPPVPKAADPRSTASPQPGAGPQSTASPSAQPAATSSPQPSGSPAEGEASPATGGSPAPAVSPLGVVD